MKKEELLKFCKLYHGEKQNPIDKSQDEFKWYMWNSERLAVINASQCKTIDVAEEVIKDEILAAINLFADVPFGGEAKPFIEKYFKY